ncbi:alpha/beta hydrolase [Echinicola jeungdonensis]|uniref:Alpha/beta hydrolase n=1 Tax=Echinicola jeungdonensis TaxID=709343 RepID=A0ABV5J3E9_9BACT|nr:alpha/beta hydrolase [Echinicola jeungdonensis]MDN3669578.1 alpha/beta hydrolase [Echinicola jeungdonensis]
MYQKVSFTSTAFYSQSHEPTGQETSIWIIFHGYGQLAPYFLNKFSPLFHNDRLFIAPEATNYAYQKGFSGKVGANWMTKHQREQAIKNNHHFLNAMLSQVLKEFKKTPAIHVLGFSQGAATATRWSVQTPYSIDELVLWGGGFAHDLKIPDTREKLATTKILMVHGKNDPFLSEERLKEQQIILEKVKLKTATLYYPGGHDIYLPLLQELINSSDNPN